MFANHSIEALRAADPAVRLEPLSAEARAVLSDQITASTWRPHRYGMRRVKPFQLLAAAAAALVVGVGAAWAAGVASPLSIFQSNPQQDGHDGHSGGIWDQRVVPDSVVEAARVDLPRIGTVGFWYGDAAQGGWCGALRLPSGSWVGTGKDPLDAGGTVPGCFPTRETINGASGSPVFAINGFDYVEGQVDARAAGGSFWRIDYGKTTAPGAVRVVDTVSGRSARIVHGDLFALAIPDAEPESANRLHLVAYDANGKVVATT